MPTPTSASPALNAPNAEAAPTLPPRRNGPSKHCAAKLTQLILRASPSAMITLGDTLRFAFDQQISDDALIPRIAAALGVEPDGWPLDPIAHRRARLERFYQCNAVPMDWRKVELVLSGPHSIEEIVSTLYRKYQRNEIGESLDPDVRLRETLIQIFTRASHDMLPFVDRFVQEQATSSMSHEAYLDRVCDALGVCTDGWPLDPDERLRRRLTSFYEKNDPAKLDRVEVLMQRQFTEEEMFAALYERYGKDELGQRVETERHLREQLHHLLEPTGGEDKIDALIAYKAENRWTDVELHYAVRRLLKIGLDGWPLDPADRIRARVRRFFRINNDHHNRSTTSAQHRKTPSRDTIASFRAAAAQSQATLASDTPSEQRFPPPPPLLSDEELNLLLHHDAILDELLQEELADIRRRSTGLEERRPTSPSSSSGAAKISLGDAPPPSPDVVSRLTSWILRPKQQPRKEDKNGSADGAPKGEPQKRLLPPLDTLTPEEEELLMERLCVRFRRSELGEVLISDADRARVNEELIPFLERFVRRPRHVHDMAKELSELRLSEEQIWSTARGRFEQCTEHTAFVKLREQLHVVLSRCAPKDIPKIPKIMRMMYEDDLSPAEVMETVQRRYRVDEQGWPKEPVQRRKTQLSMLFQRNDPSRLPLIDSLYASIPASAGDDRLYEQLCAEFGTDELGRPAVVATHPTIDDEVVSPQMSKQAALQQRPLSSSIEMEDPLRSASATFESDATADGQGGRNGVAAAQGSATKGRHKSSRRASSSASPPPPISPSKPVEQGFVEDSGAPDIARPTHSPLLAEDARRASASREAKRNASGRHWSSVRDGGSREGNGASSVGVGVSVDRADTSGADAEQHSVDTATVDAVVTGTRNLPSPAAGERRRFFQPSQPLQTVTRRLPLSGTQQQPPDASLHRSQPPDAHVAALRSLNARERWNGNEAASAVAAVIGDGLLQQLQKKYGAEDFAWVSAAPATHSPEKPAPQLQPPVMDHRAPSLWSSEPRNEPSRRQDSRRGLQPALAGSDSKDFNVFGGNPLHTVRKEVSEILQQSSRGGGAPHSQMSKRRQPLRTVLDDMASHFVPQPVPPITDWSELLPDDTRKRTQQGVRERRELPWE